MVITRRSAGAVAAIWLAAVVGVSATAWVAIDRAGRDITNDVVKTMPSTPDITPTTSPQPTSESPETSAARTPVATRKPSIEPGPVVVKPAPPAKPAKRAPASTAHRAPTPQDRTIPVTGGRVSVRCTGATIALRFAQPEFDWRVYVDTFNVGTIYVSFRTGEEESRRRTQVTAVCTNGVPSFRVRNG